MLSGSTNSTEWAPIDLNTESSHLWAQEIQCSVDVTCSEMSDATYPKALASPSIPWGGGKIYHFMDSSLVADGNACFISHDVDFRNRIIIVLDAYAVQDPTYLPLTSGSYKAPGTNEWNPYLQWNYGRKTFWSGTGSLDADPPVQGTYLKWMSHNDATPADTRGYLFVEKGNSPQPGWLKFRNKTGVSNYYSFTIFVSDQMPYRLP